MRSRDHSPITDGTAQDARFPAPLGDHYFDVDERSFEDLISRTAEFAKLVRYYSPTDQNITSWKPLFATDEIVILCDIINTDSVRMEAEYREQSGVSPEAAAEYLIRFALRIDGWFQRLRDVRNESGFVMTRNIRELIERKLKGAIDTVARLFPPRRSGAEQSSYDTAVFRRFHAIWGLARHAEASEREPGQPAAPPEREKALLETFYSLVGAISYLKPLALEQLSASRRSGRHDPAIALFFTFAHLFGKAQYKANRFTARHRDFYYGEVLRMTPRDQHPDSTFLAFHLDPGRTSLRIPKGTRFTPGKIGEVEPLYETDIDLEANDLRPADLRTLHAVRDPQVSPEFELGYADALRIAKIPLAGSSPASDTEVMNWPLFGANWADSATSPAEDAQAGFAVACSALRLREGDRDVTVTVVLEDLPAGADPSLGQRFRRIVLGCADNTPETVADFHTVALKALGLSNETPQEERDQELLLQDPKYMFDVVVGSAFSISLTTAAGWLRIRSYGVQAIPSTVANQYVISFSFTLGPDAPALSPAIAGVHGADFQTSLPVIRFLLSPNAKVYAFSLFCELRVETVEVESRVKGATRVVAWNQFGQLDPSRPFAPFGPLPTTNSYLIFGNYDAAGMKLTSLDVEIEWGDLPESAEGFAEYYRNYDTVFANDVFLAELSVLSNGRWRPETDEPAAVVRLFDGRKNLRIGRTRAVNIDLLRYFRPIDPALPEEQFSYDQRARGGFFRIDLAAPDAAFGHREYTAVLTRTLSENAHPPRWSRNEPKPLPNPPYTPVMNRLSLDFTARSTIRAGDASEPGPYTEKVCLIHPFGVETVDDAIPWPLLPPCPYNGNLFVGLSGTRCTGNITLLFHLREDSATSIAATPEPVRWSYLASNQWKPLGEALLLSDSTMGFLTSGIVTIDLPEDLSSDNTVMPGGLYWLRVSADNNFSSFCSLYSIRTQAVPVTRALTADAPLVLPHPLPGNSIKGPIHSIPGLRQTEQPVASRGGRAKETPQQKITRASERLRHKARAISPFDYERLVLEEFPEIVKVKCFSAMTSETERRPAPGSVMVVVVPRQSVHHSNPVFDPMLDAITLKRIRDYLRSCASPHVRIEVRNPAYEEVIVRCAVALRRDKMHDRGFWLNQLNQALVDYLSPWSVAGPKPRFGWSVEGNEVQAFIRGLDYIDFVTQFSMLHMTLHMDGNDERRYRLRDTADAPGGTVVIEPRYPWSLAIPNPRHILETIENRQPLDPDPTGIGRLEIGNTFTVRESAGG